MHEISEGRPGPPEGLSRTSGAQDLVNLDLDPRDAQRLQPFRRQRKDFDDKNWASVRRTLAELCQGSIDPDEAKEREEK